MRLGQALISTLIVGVLGMQSLAYFTGSRLYPFVNYPMFSQSWGPPIEVVIHQMHAEMPDGRRVNVSADYMNLHAFAWRELTVRRIIAEPVDGPTHDLVEEHRAESLLDVLAAIDEHEGQSPVALHFTLDHHRVVAGEIEKSTDYQTLVLDTAADDE